MTVKICLDCKYFDAGSIATGGVNMCHHDDNVDLVLGGKRSVPAIKMREDESRCGREGRLWAQSK